MHPPRFGVRHIIPAESVQGIGWIARMAQAHPAEEDAAVGLVLLLPGYFVEWGSTGTGAAGCALGDAPVQARRGGADGVGVGSRGAGGFDLPALHHRREQRLRNALDSDCAVFSSAAGGGVVGAWVCID